MNTDSLTSQASISGKLLATVHENLLHAKVSALRMLAVLAVGGVFMTATWLVFDEIPTVLGIAVVIAMLICVWAAIIMLIQVFKLIFKRRSTFEIREDGFIWKKHRWLHHRPSQQAAPWQVVQIYQHIVNNDSSGVREELKSARTVDDAAAGVFLYAIFNGIPDRHMLWLTLRDGTKIRLSELSGDVHLLDQVVTEINPGTVLRQGPGKYQFNVAPSQQPEAAQTNHDSSPNFIDNKL